LRLLPLPLEPRVLPLGNSFVHVQGWAEERGLYEFGQVNHALSAATREYLREYRMLICKLEYQLLQVKWIVP
ncbi:unnamed protein product, partial [Discosporangium mesarthrocarpum]